jgi:hypothetical protein
VRRVVADGVLALKDVFAVLRQAGAVEQFEGSGIGAGKYDAVDVDMGPVDAVSGVQRREGGGVGVTDLDRLAREGVEVVHLAVPDAIAGALEQGTGWPVSAAPQQHYRKNKAQCGGRFSLHSSMCLLGPRPH